MELVDAIAQETYQTSLGLSCPQELDSQPDSLMLKAAIGSFPH